MRKYALLMLVVVFIVGMSSLTLAGKVPTPTDPPSGVTIVSASDAKPLVNQTNVKVFDMRKALNFGKGHIPGAASLPYKWLSKGDPSKRTGEFNMSKLPADKSVKIIFHSDGPNGWKSYYASKAAVEAGHKNVMWMREGFATWKEKGYTVEH